MAPPKTDLLIVDDDASLRDTLSSLFVQLGFTVRNAQDGKEALAAVSERIPEILLTDLYMPRISGFELLVAMKKTYPAARLVAMSSAYPSDGAPTDLPYDAYYEKGSGIGLLLQKIVERPVQREVNLRERRRAAASSRARQATA